MNTASASATNSNRSRLAATRDREEPRIFVCIYPCGIVFADRFRKRHGEHVQLAFLPYTTLVLEFEKACDSALRLEIEASVRAMNLKAGDRFRIAGNCEIVLGPRAEA